MQILTGPRLPAAVRETHSGVVFLLGDRAYKLKKPVTLGFLDFSTRERRDEAVVVSCGSTGGSRRTSISASRRCSIADGPAVRSLVVMRRMPEESPAVLAGPFRGRRHVPPAAPGPRTSPPSTRPRRSLRDHDVGGSRRQPARPLSPQRGGLRRPSGCRDEAAPIGSGRVCGVHRRARCPALLTGCVRSDRATATATCWPTTSSASTTAPASSTVWSSTTGCATASARRRRLPGHGPRTTSATGRRRRAAHGGVRRSSPAEPAARDARCTTTSPTARVMRAKVAGCPPRSRPSLRPPTADVDRLVDLGLAHLARAQVRMLLVGGSPGDREDDARRGCRLTQSAACCSPATGSGRRS